MNHHIEDTAEIPECFRQIEERLNSTEIQRLQSDTGSPDAYHRKLKRDRNAVEASFLSENQELRDEVGALKRTLAAKDAEIDSLRASGNNVTELAHIGAQLKALKDDTNTLVTENRILRESVNEFKAHAKDCSDNQATVTELQVKLISEQKITEQLTTKISESSSALEQLTDLSQRLRSRNENNEKELKELRAKLNAAEKDRDWHSKQHAAMLEDRNKINAARASDRQRFAKENNQLKQENSILAQDLQKQFRDIGHFIADLELAAEEVRVYTCLHEDFNEIRWTSDKSTRVKPMGLIANEMYKHWAKDTRFQEGYADARKTICNHHATHEKAGHKNGDTVNEIQSVLNELDQKRRFAQLFSSMKS